MALSAEPTGPVVIEGTVVIRESAG
jgi:hypothetical protein